MDSNDSSVDFEKVFSTVEKRLRTQKETIALGFAVLGLCAGLVGWVYGGIQTRIEEEKNIRLAAEKKEADNKIAQLQLSNSSIAALEIVTRYANELPGTATVFRQVQNKDKDGNVVIGPDLPEEKMSSQAAILRFGTNLDKSKGFDSQPNAVVKQIELTLDTTAISGMNNLATILAKTQPTKEDQLNRIDNYILPILFARCNSTDPTEAGGALSSISHIVHIMRLPPPASTSTAQSSTQLANNASTEEAKTRKTPAKNATSQPAGNISSGSGSAMQEPVALNSIYNLSVSSKAQVAKVFAGGFFNNVSFEKVDSDFHSFNFRGATFSHSRLANANFSGADLSGALLSGGYLKNCDFANAHMQVVVANRKTDLSGATFEECKSFRDCNLTGLVMKGVKLRSCNLRDAILNEVEFSDTEIDDTYLGFTGNKKGDFHPKQIAKAKFASAQFENARFRENFEFQEVETKASERVGLSEKDRKLYLRFSNCELRGVGFKDSVLRSTLFEDCDLEKAAFNTAKIDAIENVVINRGSAIHAVFGNTPLAFTFNGVDLSGADLGACPIPLKSLTNVTLDWARVSDVEGATKEGATKDEAEKTLTLCQLKGRAGKVAENRFKFETPNAVLIVVSKLPAPEDGVIYQLKDVISPGPNGFTSGGKEQLIESIRANADLCNKKFKFELKSGVRLKDDEIADQVKKIWQLRI